VATDVAREPNEVGSARQGIFDRSSPINDFPALRIKGNRRQVYTSMIRKGVDFKYKSTVIPAKAGIHLLLGFFTTLRAVQNDKKNLIYVILVLRPL